MSSTDREAGFTLLEVMAVMLIIALVASLVVTMAPGTGRAGLKAVMLQTAALLRRERSGASWAAALSGCRSTANAGFLLETAATRCSARCRGGYSRCRRDLVGTACGRALSIRTGRHPERWSDFRVKGGYEIRVNWYTGGVAIVSVSP